MRRYFLNGSCLAVLLLSFGGFAQGQAPAAVPLPDGDGKDLFSVACSQCHSLQIPLRLRNGPQGWKTMVERMIVRGAQLSPEESETVVNYLSRNFGPGTNPMVTKPLPKTALARSSSSGSGDTVALPSGDGKDLVESRCQLCHDLGRVVATRRSKADWERIVRNMNSRGPQAAPEQVQTIISYLAAKFGSGTN